MSWLSLLPQRCLSCAGPTTSGVLCRVCQARYQGGRPPEVGLGYCPICGQVNLAEAKSCMDCAAQAWSFPLVEGLFGYQEAAGELLRLYKFGGLTRLLRTWKTEAASRLQPRAPLVPVPPLRKNLWRRGWDPVDAFVLQVAREAAVPVWRPLVRRRSASQKSLDRQGRSQNARLAYRLAAGGQKHLRGAPLVWLIDDVVTTGATVDACSRLLLDAGVKEVRVFCLGLH